MKSAIRAALNASLFLTVAGFAAHSATPGSSQDIEELSMDTVKHLNAFQAIEFRRYNTSEGERPHFEAAKTPLQSRRLRFSHAIERLVCAKPESW
ncbi:MAG TPA: hypothetical protein VGI90_16160 [Steroidobacteraceae bacterium]|jgi:hypothetical protein